MVTKWWWFSHFYARERGEGFNDKLICDANKGFRYNDRMLTQVKDYYSDDIYYFNSHRNIEQVLLLKDRYKLFSESKEKILPELFARHGLKVKSIDTKESNFGTGHVIYFVTTEEGKTYVYRGNV